MSKEIFTRWVDPTIEEKDKEIERLNNTLEAYKNKDSDTTQWLNEANEEIERLNKELEKLQLELDSTNSTLKKYTDKLIRIAHLHDHYADKLIRIAHLHDHYVEYDYREFDKLLEEVLYSE